MVNHDFLKAILSEDKCLLELSQVRFISMPIYDELAVKKLWPVFKEHAPTMRYFPDQLPGGKLPCRVYFWNVVNTLHTDYVASILATARSQRHVAEDRQNEMESVKVSSAWWDKLNSIPFQSRKYSLNC